MKIGKYEFKSKEQAIDKILALGFEVKEKRDGSGEYKIPTHKHLIVHIGSVLLKEAKFGLLDEEKVMEEKGAFEVLEPPVFGGYRVDVLWKELHEHPYGWKTYSLDLDTEGMHSFGVSYLENKM
jgi:hypothetical protein